MRATSSWCCHIFLLALLAVVGCGHANSGSDPGPSTADAADEGTCEPGFDLTNGTCTTHFDECTAPATIPKPGGGCVPVGVPPDQCGAGFVADGNGGCDAILPKDACPSGQMAVPGETTCREVAPCGTGTWGDIPVEASTVYVDRGYAGGSSDGTSAKPFVTIQAAIDKAKIGAIVAVGARGTKETYVENLVVAKSVRVWGRCPALVEVQGVATDAPAVDITGPAELHRLAVTGPAFGVQVHALDAIVQQVWIHDQGSDGLYVFAGARATVRETLVERAIELAVAVFSAELTLESSAIRDTRASSAGKLGRGVEVDVSSTKKTSSKATVKGSLIERNIEFGLAAFGSEVTMDASVIRDTRARADGYFGIGFDLAVSTTTKLGSKATVQGSLIERNTEAGVAAIGSELTMDACVVRDTQPRSDGELGRGFDIDVDATTKLPSKATVRRTLVDRNGETGMVVLGSELVLEASVIRDTHARPDGKYGAGLNIQMSATTKAGSKATLQGTLIERNLEAGVAVFGSEVTVDACVVRGTKAGDAIEKWGDGLSVFLWPRTDDFSPGSLVVTRSIVRDNARAGLSTFGARLDVSSSVIECNLFDIDYEKLSVQPSGTNVGSVDDVNVPAGNACGCGSASPCRAQSNDLSALATPI